MEKFVVVEPPETSIEVIREMVMGTWTWSAEGQEDAEIEFKEGGHCAVWKADHELHPAEYCVWDVVNG
jgi:hypothetical protein